MDLFEQLKSLSEMKRVNERLDTAKLCRQLLDDWYETKPEPDYRMTKLLGNLIFYLEAPESEVTFRDEILDALAKTLLRTADYDINIRECPDKVRARNDSVLRLCADRKSVV